MRHIEKLQPIFIMSFFKDGKSLAGSRLDEAEILRAAGFKFKECLRAYKGETERSWVVIDDNLLTKQRLLTLADKYKQESVLERKSNSQCYIIMWSRDILQHISLGQWSSVPELFAKKIGQLYLRF